MIGDKKVLFMANHGISTVGATVADAYDMLYYVERAAQVQIYAMWTGQKLKQLPAPWSKRPSAITRTIISTRARPRPSGTSMR